MFGHTLRGAALDSCGGAADEASSRREPPGVQTVTYPVAHAEEQQGGVVNVDGAPERLEEALDALKVSRGRSSEHARPGDNGRLPAAAALGRQELAQGEDAEVGAGVEAQEQLDRNLRFGLLGPTPWAGRR